MPKAYGVHVNLSADALRGRFATHLGKELISIRREEFFLGSATNNWAGAINDFGAKLGAYLGGKKELVVSDFSTTGLVERAASQLVLMSATQHYGECEMVSVCSIPQITSLGTADDWKSVLQAR